MTAVIVLNWNGVEDTLACLASLRKMPQRDYELMVVDNGSTDNSLSRISRWLEEYGETCVRINEEGGAFVAADGAEAAGRRVGNRTFLLSLSRNYGFAKGNNFGVAFFEKCAEKGVIQPPDYYLLLNNDTVVEPDFLRKLEEFAALHPEFTAFTPQIRYMEPSDRIWNCGGRMTFGFRRYCYGEKAVSQIKPEHTEYIPINLITGCALFVRREWVGKSDAGPSRLLTERFFFGEEDFEFSLRVQKSGKKMACVMKSVIFHKQGATQKSFRQIPRMRVHYLNRFIDVRRHWPRAKYRLWVCVYFPYMVRLFKQQGLSFRKAVRQVAGIIRDSRRMDGVGEALFHDILSGKA